MKKTIAGLFAAALLSLIILPEFGASRTPQGKDLPTDVKVIIKQNCSVSGCHQGKYPAARLNFESDQFLTSVIDKPSQEAQGWKIVDSADPAASYLLAKIKGEAGISGKRMPLNREPLTAEQIQKIEAWLLSLKTGPPKTAAGI
jgi:mono/diheme cytochrome c family protein